MDNCEGGVDSEKVPENFNVESESTNCAHKSVTQSSNIDILDGALDPHRFKNTFLQVVEELRMRRSIDVENDSCIKDLLADNHDLKKQLEEEKASIAILMESHSQSEERTKNKYEDKVKYAEDEKAKTQIRADNWDHELKSLKDEIRALNLLKYNLERRVTEQVRQLDLQESSRISYLSQMNELDQKLNAALKYAENITEQMDNLETNVKSSKDLHIKLQYLSEHRNCELEIYKARLEKCQSELMEVRVKAEETQSPEYIEGVASKAKATDQELEIQTELNKQLQDQLSSLRKEHQDVLRQLKDAHSLIEQHARSCDAITLSEEKLREETIALNLSINDLQQKLESLFKAKQVIEEQSLLENESWSVKYKDVEERLKSLQDDYTVQQETHHKELEVKASQFKATEQTLKNEILNLNSQLLTCKNEMNNTIMREQNIPQSFQGASVLTDPHITQSKSREDFAITPSHGTENITYQPSNSLSEIQTSPIILEGSQSEQCNNMNNKEVLKSTSPIQTSLSPKNHIKKVLIPKAECKANCELLPIDEIESNRTGAMSVAIKRQHTEEVEPLVENSPKKLKVCTEGLKNHDEIENKETVNSLVTCSKLNTNIPTDDIISSGVASVTKDQSNTPNQRGIISCGKQVESVQQVETEVPSTSVAIVFSDEDEDVGDQRLLSTQMNKQIDKVQMFLKLDKLRRPKKL